MHYLLLFSADVWEDIAEDEALSGIESLPGSPISHTSDHDSEASSEKQPTESSSSVSHRAPNDSLSTIG